MDFSWIGILALLFARSAVSQGSSGLGASNCGTSQTGYYVGCFDLTTIKSSMFPITPYPNGYSDNDAMVPIGTAGAYNTFPNYQNSVNITSLTNYNCFLACRGHGFAYSATISQGTCYCSSIPPIGTAQSTDYSAVGPSNLCHSGQQQAAPALYTETGCIGDPTQWCGSDVSQVNYGDVYLDNSFVNYANTASSKNSVYTYLGCFIAASNQLFYTPTASTVIVTQAACFAACANQFNAPFAGFTPGSATTTGYATYISPSGLHESC
jgi:hypothetical protein